MSAAIDPKTRDYTLTDAGALQVGSEHQNAVLIALTAHQGSVPGFPRVGSTLHKLRKKASVADVRDRVLLALKELITQGIIESPVVEVQGGQIKGRVDVRLTYKAGGQSHQFDHFVRVV